MDLYVDTSVVVAAITREPHTERAQEMLAGAGGELRISNWTLTEVAAALSLKSRRGGLGERDRVVALRTFERLRQEALETVPVLSLDFTEAAARASRADLSLRAGDALHLAIAERVGTRIATFDSVMGRAASMLGLTVVQGKEV